MSRNPERGKAILRGGLQLLICFSILAGFLVLGGCQNKSDSETPAAAGRDGGPAAPKKKVDEKPAKVAGTVPAAAPDIPVTLTVLPIANATGKADMDWLAVGLQDALTVDLWYCRGFLTFALPALVNQGKRPPQELSRLSRYDTLKLAGELSLSHIVYGRYAQGEGGRLLLSFEALQVETGKAVWQQQVSAAQPAALLPLLPDVVLDLGKALKVFISREEAQRLRFPSTTSETAFRLNAEGFAWQQQATFHQEKRAEYTAQAVTVLQRAVEADPHYAEAWNNLGWNLILLEKKEEAAQAFQKALAVKPDLVDANMGFGYVRLDQKKALEAIVPLEKGIKLNPSLKDHYKYLLRVYAATNADDKGLATLRELDHLLAKLQRDEERLAGC